MASKSAPLRRSRYSSVLESALVGLGREDAVVNSTRKPRKKRRYDDNLSPIRRLPQSFSAPDQPQEEEEKKKKKRDEDQQEEFSSPAVTRSAAKQRKKHRKRHAGVLEMAGRTPVTRSMQKKWKRSSLEKIEDLEEQEQEQEDFEIQKKLDFQSPKKEAARKKRKATVLMNWSVEWPPVLETGSDRVRMVVTGQVDGKTIRFEVGKRENAKKFTSTDGEYVTLSGKLDRKSAGAPSAALELMEDGIPAFFSKRLLPFVVKPNKEDRTDKPKKKKARTVDKSRDSSPMPSIDEVENFSFEVPVASSPIQDDDVFETPKAKKTRAPVKRAKKSPPEPEAEADIWTHEQSEALIDAKLKIPTTASNFWAQVALHVPGKSAQECQAKTFEQFRSPPTNRKPAKKPIKKANADTIPSKIARAGSNKFKKQVREFVEEYEKKHVDDLFDTTPSKEGLPELPEFDSIKSPELGTPSRSFDDDSEMDDEAPGLLQRLSSRRRDDIDSYVLGINRQHVAGGGVMAGGKVRRVTSMVTPVKSAKGKATSAKKRAVMLVEDVGSHSLRGVVSPGGTTHIRVEKDGSSSEDEGEDNYSSEEEDFDIP
ncbi:Mis18-binding protein 1 [Phytophthora citrophthora]|uniref:Mis18-binding protein 1 n=1 Tax=Phytophthora citrophthora TaxID=4793 RepID=A0AAD9GAU0_9STRA|nr:Mis18-binding protein 1 [Phytophthora citrophthora]